MNINIGDTVVKKHEIREQVHAVTHQFSLNNKDTLAFMFSGYVVGRIFITEKNETHPDVFIWSEQNQEHEEIESDTYVAVSEVLDYVEKIKEEYCNHMASCEVILALKGGTGDDRIKKHIYHEVR